VRKKTAILSLKPILGFARPTVYKTQNRWQQKFALGELLLPPICIMSIAVAVAI
jgi:hypothetical protein